MTPELRRTSNVDDLEASFLPERADAPAAVPEKTRDWIAEFAPDPETRAATTVHAAEPLIAAPSYAVYEPPQWLHRVVGAAAVILVAAFVFTVWQLWRKPVTPPPSHAAAQLASTPDPPAAAQPAVPVSDLGDAPAVATDDSPSARQPATAGSRSRSREAQPAPTTLRVATKPPVVPPARSDRAAPPAAALPAAPFEARVEPTPVPLVETRSGTPMDTVLPTAPRPSPPVPRVETPAAAPHTDTPPAPSAPSSLDSVRATLGRFADAYSSLDAAAAERVWPSVNRTALARAFQDLSRQEVSLGECRIDIAAETAHASCRGSVDWTPKVGGARSRTEARTWDFTLKKSNEGWQIASARIRSATID